MRLDTARAKHASEVVLNRFGALGGTAEASGGVAIREYRSLVLGGPALLRQAGLVQLVAFWLSKGTAERAVVGDLARWLRQSPVTQHLAGARANPARQELPAEGGPALVQALVERGDDELLLLTHEAEAILEWLKRITEGRFVQLETAEKAAASGQSTEHEAAGG